MTSEAVLRVQFGTPNQRGAGIELLPVLLERRYLVGRGNPAVSDLRRQFDYLRTERFDLWAYRGSLAAAKLRTIATTRERGARQIEQILGVRLRSRILLVFYPDSASKTRDTGHIGNGFASGHTIVEIYNDSVQLDPYHELAHIIGGELGDPPALFDEGFATYVSERLGAPALRYLGYGDQKLREAGCSLAREDRLIPLSELLTYSEIGSTASRPDVAYPESASLVQFFVEDKGLTRFREAYRALRSGSSAEAQRHNVEVLTRVFGAPPQELEVAWRGWLGC
jgi:hypothetical protein